MPDFARRGLNAGDEVGDVGELLELLVSRPSWHADALCKEYPEVTFFPSPQETGREAVSVCRRCLVQAECRDWSLSQEASLKGVWGGLTEHDRRRWRAGKAA